MLPIVVVDVSGDGLDAAHTRKMLEHELSVTAVAPDDPRAANAEGRIDVSTDAKEHKLTVRYQKVDNPVERTIDLPADAARTESEAVFLAGNLARDEAGELAPAKKPDKPPPPPPSVKDLLSTEDDRRLATMRAFLTQSSADERAANIRAGVAEVAIAGALLAPGIVLWARGGASEEANGFANAAAIFGTGLLARGIVSLAIQRDPFEPFHKQIREAEAKGTHSGEVIADVEREWAAAADGASRWRKIGGSILLGLAAGSITLGCVLESSSPGDVRHSGVPYLALGGMFAVDAFAALVSESPVERSHRLWKTMHSTHDEGAKISFGASVLPGGGGAASFALTF